MAQISQTVATVGKYYSDATDQHWSLKKITTSLENGIQETYSLRSKQQISCKNPNEKKYTYDGWNDGQMIAGHIHFYSDIDAGWKQLFKISITNANITIAAYINTNKYDYSPSSEWEEGESITAIRNVSKWSPWETLSQVTQHK